MTSWCLTWRLRASMGWRCAGCCVPSRATNKLPVIALSASDHESHKVEAFSAGADDYIIKPSTPASSFLVLSLTFAPPKGNGN